MGCDASTRNWLSFLFCWVCYEYVTCTGHLKQIIFLKFLEYRSFQFHKLQERMKCVEIMSTIMQQMVVKWQQMFGKCLVIMKRGVNVILTWFDIITTIRTLLWELIATFKVIAWKRTSTAWRTVNIVKEHINEWWKFISWPNSVEQCWTLSYGALREDTDKLSIIRLCINAVNSDR